MTLSRRQLGVAAAGLTVASRAGAAPEVEGPLELWTWTTSEQIRGLEKWGLLFTRAERPDVGKGYAFEVLAKWKDDATAQLLLSERFEKGRFVWSNPWATCLGFGGESYGPELVRIELKPGSVLSRFSSRSGPPEAVNDAARLAGFHFENESADLNGTHCSTFRGDGAWREIYVGDEQRVAGWSRKSRAISARLERDISFLSRLSRDAAGLKVPDVCSWLASVKQAWRGEGSGALAEYARQLAFASPEYRPTPENLRRIIAVLQARLRL
ncbi:MAG: hypothetical protein JNK82_07330 [Myxococcaceae bacterium]|nr:hypothetical protein [Myxococcaceae bacterium]